MPPYSQRSTQIVGSDKQKATKLTAKILPLHSIAEYTDLFERHSDYVASATSSSDQWMLSCQLSSGSLPLFTLATLSHFWNPQRNISHKLALNSRFLATHVLPPNSGNVASLQKLLTVSITSCTQGARKFCHARQTPSTNSTYPRP